MPLLPLLAVVAAVLWTGWGLVATPAWAVPPRWTSPVYGAPTRLFALGPDPFARGRHRGVDLEAAPGERVRAACGGRVVFAGRVAGSGTVSVRCGPWRVSYAPLGRIAVRAGALVAPGRGLGRVSKPNGHAPRPPGRAGPRVHAGLHLGVRRESERFGYVDPLRFLAAADRAPPPVLPALLPRPAPRPRAAPHPARPSPALAPWPVWLGLALLMTGLAGVGTLRFPLRETGGAACRASSTSSSSPTTPSSP
jgi:Peptidase family M23